MRHALGLTFCCILLALPLAAQSTDDHQGVSNILGAGARAWGMGGAFIALADDATAASWNPAGLALLVKPEVSLVMDSGKGDLEWRYRYNTVRQQRREITESIRDTGRNDYSGVAFASATYPLRLRNRPAVVELSYRRLSTFPGILNPYRTSTTTFDASGAVVGVQEYANVYETSHSGGFDSYGASFAGAAGRKLKLGLTANYIRSDVSSMTVVAGSSGQGSSSAELGMSYAFSGVTFDVGALYSPVPRLSLGAVYHSGFSAPFWYEASLQMSDGPFGSSGGRSRMRWPDGFGIGAAVRPSDYFTLSADAAMTRWSRAKVDSMHVSTLRYDGARGWTPEWDTVEGLGFPYFGVEQHDTTNVRLGAEYVFFYRDAGIPLRAGVFSEEQATNTWDDEHDLQKKPRYSGYTAGVGVSLGHVQVDLAYVLTRGTDDGRKGAVDADTTVDLETGRVRNRRLILSALYRF